MSVNFGITQTVEIVVVQKTNLHKDAHFDL